MRSVIWHFVGGRTSAFDLQPRSQTARRREPNRPTGIPVGASRLDAQFGAFGGSRATASAMMPMQTRRLRLVVDAYSSLGCKSFGNDTVPGNLGAGVGSGPVTIIDCGFFGGPCPPESCATANVVAVDATTKRVTIAHFILVLLRVDRGGGKVGTQSIGNVAG
jgi:hypothetical protein